MHDAHKIHGNLELMDLLRHTARIVQLAASEHPPGIVPMEFHADQPPPEAPIHRGKDIGKT